MKSKGDKETIEFIEDVERKKKLETWLKQGYRVRCLGCGTVYKNTPEQPYEDGHGGRNIRMCRCGSDLFIDLKELIAHKCKTVKIEPVGETIVLKEHHFKYCKCRVGEVWTGDAGTECRAESDFELFMMWPNDRKVYLCPKSGLRIVVLKSTKEEREKPDEMGSKYFRIPG